MNDYQQEQLDALKMVRQGLVGFGEAKYRQLVESTHDYMRFRESVDQFLDRYFAGVCTQTCYRDRTSACCSKDGIITFFADTVINALHSEAVSLDCLEAALHRPNNGHRCIYLGADGCMWTVRPIVCAMFLCDRAMRSVYRDTPGAKDKWEHLRRQAKTFKWPDRPVLFDDLEKVFLASGYRSTLMHLNLSPGLLRIKKNAGLSMNLKLVRSRISDGFVKSPRSRLANPEE